eukprot:gnl/MRDRNA2_/MRDRNA2_110485_c0_seq1.p1 gnl/MRDRNA2_/MRDRNA2_110485_c0~~gnl/MRDRNA2_/MRDRNA2_110485_c0_seq1.p1  ORF type:complete len:216 (-),score=48.23 gnl/MRDRNA2_/MRDRNA2_110485_c0_seq1:177-824(-)
MGATVSHELRPEGVWGWLCKSCFDQDELKRRRAAADKEPGLQAQQKAALAFVVDEKLRELFNLHDLKGDGFLEEQELVKLNEKIAMLHYGSNTDKQVVKAKYQELFRTKLDREGQPVPYSVFHTYMHQLLNDIDSSLHAQEMILEQFIAEAQSGRMAFYTCASFQSLSDEPFLPRLSTAELGMLRCCDPPAPASRSESIESLLPRRVSAASRMKM